MQTWISQTLSDPWGINVMSNTSVPIRFAYDPESAEMRFMQKHVYGQWRSLTEMFGIAVMLLVLYLLVRIAMREYGAFFAALNPALVNIAPLVLWAGIVLGLAGAYLCGLLVERIHDTITEAGNENAVFNKGPIEVVLDPEGIHTTSESMAQFIKWKSVKKVVSTPQGIGLRLDRSHFIPVIDVELPQGVTRADVMEAIERWRKPAA